MSFLKSNKVLHHPEKFGEWLRTGDTSGPITVKIDLTNVCNHNCPGCIDFDLIENDNNHLSVELLDILLDDLKTCGVSGINYTGGGEPTVHKKFDEIIRMTHSKGFEIGLICNGSRFHKWNMEELLSMFTWIRVSLDAYDKDTHKRTHGPAANFELTIKNLQELVRIKTEQGLETTLGAGYITNQHQDMDRQLYRFIEVCKTVGIDYSQLRPSFGFLYDYESISQVEWNAIFDEARSYQDDTFNVIIDEGKFNKIINGEGTTRSYTRCHAQAFKATSITATGDVYICCSLSGVKSGWIGNIKDESFIDIWQGPKRNELVDNLDVSKCPHLCVGDNLNEYLDDFIKIQPEHKNFL